MDKAKLVELAERCEAATGPDRELDATIAIAIRWKPLGNIKHWVHDWGPGLEGTNREGWVKLAQYEHSDHWEVPAYTASLDAALTLVPEGWGWNVSWPNSKARASGLLKVDTPCRGEVEFCVDNRFIVAAATPALALTAACLRALAAKEPLT